MDQNDTPPPSGGEEDAHRLIQAGYSTRAIHAKWVLDAFKVLYGHLTDDGKPLEDDGKLDSAFYLSDDEWRDVCRAAKCIVDLAPLIASMRELGIEEWS